MENADTLSFLTAAGPDYIAEMYARYEKNPDSVDESWSQVFGALGEDTKLLLPEIRGASWRPAPEKLRAVLPPENDMGAVKSLPKKEGKPANGVLADAKTSVSDSMRALLLIRAYQIAGHFSANLDPLSLMQRGSHPELDLAAYGFSEADLDRTIYLGKTALGIESATLREILKKLQKIYSGTIGVEFMHLQVSEQRSWLLKRLEETSVGFSAAEKKAFLTRLTATEGFEIFLHTKFPGAKRFGIEGGESAIPALEEIIGSATSLGVREVVIGVAHRGRLNILTNVMGKSFVAMFSEFQGGSSKPDQVHGSSDVKYHLGASADRDFGGNVVHMTLTPNPSHLEFVDPVVLGKARAKQALRSDDARVQVMPILIHGDAALAGQGIVQETLMMADLPGYRVGGTIHVVINNQIGFTTSPLYSRSGPYCTDIAKMSQAPIFHVNGDDVEAVMRVARIAAEFRQQFKKDVFIDIVCYRRHGHNELDEPAFTQPHMYKVIHAQKTTRALYAEKLAKEGVLSAEESAQIQKDFTARLEKDYAAATAYKPNSADMLEGNWKGMTRDGSGQDAETAISQENAQKIGRALSSVPPDFDLNSKIARQLEAKKKMFETGEGFDWTTAEALAFGALALDGYATRLSGQDSGRGTFSNRHAVLTDQKTEARYMPLNNIDPSQRKVEVHDSPLSESGVMGFEYGYSTSDPHTLVLWEAQFGDFVNGAQVIIDQFIAAGETKWLRMSGIVLLLPHGLEGQGPEHSSGRLERFLQLSAEDNWQVANCSTPANYFHILRRQMKRDFRKPLVLMTPKSLLRHKLCVSPLSMMTGKEKFRPIIADEQVTKAKRVLLCSGKLYYDLYEAREKMAVNDVALVRVEQFYPFPDKELGEVLKAYKNAEVVWCQEEPENQGAWNFLDRRIESVLCTIGYKSTRPVYMGRAAAAAPATGSAKTHAKEQEALMAQALKI